VDGGHVVPLVTIALVSFGAVALMASLRAGRDRAEAAARKARRCEADLRATEERLRLSIDAVTDYAVFMVDADGRVASWNAGAERIKGYPAAEIVGEPLSRVYERADIEAGRVDAALRAAAQTGRHEEEGWRVRAQGRIRFHRAHGHHSGAGADGVLWGFTNVTRDITEHRRIADNLRESEAKFRGVVDSAPDGIVMAGPDGRIVLAHARAATMLGYARDELVGGARRDAAPRGGACTAPGPSRRVPCGAHDAAKGAHLVARRKGHELPVEISLSPMPAAEACWSSP
jgi:PAS domain S-box-containing protein